LANSGDFELNAYHEMKKEHSTVVVRASALRIALLISLLLICSILLAASLANALAGKHGDRSMTRPAITCTVNSTGDSGPGTLRDCLASAADTIDATGVSGTILLTSGELQITHDVTINGSGPANLAVNGNAIFRVFENFASNAAISGLTITNGLADGNGGGGIFNHGGLTLSNCIVSDSSALIGNNQGGGIRNNFGATLTITDSIISGNSAVGGGSGIHSSNAQLTVTNSTITGNIGGGSGGGIFNNSGGTLMVANTTISGNSAGDGGGIGGENDITTAMVTDCVISGNSASSRGGGIFNYQPVMTVKSSTISGNSAGDAGGIWNGGNQNLTVINTTVSGNSATSSGGGISNYAQNNGLILKNSTLSGNSGPTNGGGTIFNQGGASLQIGDTVLNAGASGGTIFNNGGAITSLGYNIASDNGGGVLTGPGDQTNTDPMLGPLQDNGGPTFTHALLPGSPAIDHGDPSFSPPPDYDQRGLGYPRVVNGRIDIGSFEVQATPTPTATPTSTSTPTATATATPTPTPTSTPIPTPTATPNCVVSQGYWKIHDQWPVNQLQLGSHTYNLQELQLILQQPVRGNGLVSLAHQEIAAKLNIANGADGSCIQQTLADADALIGDLMIPPVGTGFLGPTDDQRTLTLYNGGSLCAASCEVQPTPPGSPTPPPRPRPTAPPRP
jgi:hypothetical protein